MPAARSGRPCWLAGWLPAWLPGWLRSSSRSKQRRPTLLSVESGGIEVEERSRRASVLLAWLLACWLAAFLSSSLSSSSVASSLSLVTRQRAKKATFTRRSRLNRRSSSVRCCFSSRKSFRVPPIRLLVVEPPPCSCLAWLLAFNASSQASKQSSNVVAGRPTRSARPSQPASGCGRREWQASLTFPPPPCSLPSPRSPHSSLQQTASQPAKAERGGGSMPKQKVEEKKKKRKLSPGEAVRQ